MREAAHVHAEGARPQDGHHTIVHDEEGERVKVRREAPHGNGSICLVVRRSAEAIVFVLLAAKGAYHTHAFQTFARDTRYTVELVLNGTIERD